MYIYVHSNMCKYICTDTYIHIHTYVYAYILIKFIAYTVLSIYLLAKISLEKKHAGTNTPRPKSETEVLFVNITKAKKWLKVSILAQVKDKAKTDRIQLIF